MDSRELGYYCCDKDTWLWPVIGLKFYRDEVIKSFVYYPRKTNQYYEIQDAWGYR